MLAKSPKILFLPAILLAMAIPAAAQVGTMKGKVIGADGEGYKGAVIKIERTDVTGQYEVKSKKKGSWLHAGLPLGTYNVSCEVDGEIVDTVTGVRLTMGENNVDFDLGEVQRRQQEAAAAAQAGQAQQATEEQLKSMTPEQRKQYEKELEERKKQMAKNQELNNAFNLGMEAKQAGDFATAVDSLTKAAELDPNQDVVWANLADSQAGLAKTKQGEERSQLMTQAAETYRKAVELKPTDAAYFNNLGLLLVQAGQGDEGMSMLANAAELDPANGGKYYFNLGAVMINSGNTDGAIEAFQKATEVQPSYAEAYYQLGIALSGKAEAKPDGTVVPPPGMIEALQKYMELAPSGPNAPSAQAMIASMSGAVETEFSNK